MAAAPVAASVTFLLLLVFDQAAAGSPPPPPPPSLVLEEGYTVSTVLDGNKVDAAPLHPFSLLPFPDPRRGHRILLLDTVGSAFYTLSLPVSQGSEIKRLSGNGTPGFSDGDTTTATFFKPRSFAMDSRGNVYVPDRHNHAIRKITTSGMTTTIAGGYSLNKTGHVDGTAQNATFSPDFELVFVPQICALLISDRGNSLIRQMPLKPDDCGNESHSGVGTTSRDYRLRRFTETWKRYQTHLETLATILFFGSKSAVAKSMPFFSKLVTLCLSYLLCMLRIHRREAAVVVKWAPSLLDLDAASNHGARTTNDFADQLKDLISLDGDLATQDIKKAECEDVKGVDIPGGSNMNLDEMIRANILEFTEKTKQQDLMQQSSARGSCLLKRQPRGIDSA